MCQVSFAWRCRAGERQIRWTDTMTNIEEVLRSLRVRHDPANLSKLEIPVDPGVYAWSFKTDSDTIVYVGKASASLRKRIWYQHLRAGYVEARSTKFQPKDAQQLEKSRAAGRPCVEKGVLRRAIARQHDLAPGEATVQFMRDHLLVSWFAVSSESRLDIPHIESALIQQLNPALNTSGRGGVRLRF